MVLVRYESVQILCTVKDVKTSWNKARLLVTPMAGEGEQWVELGRISIPKFPAADPSKVSYAREEMAAMAEYFKDQYAGLNQFLREK
jgi:hypothetical protein